MADEGTSMRESDWEEGDDEDDSSEEISAAQPFNAGDAWEDDENESSEEISPAQPYDPSGAQEEYEEEEKRWMNAEVVNLDESDDSDEDMPAADTTAFRYGNEALAKKDIEAALKIADGEFAWPIRADAALSDEEEDSLDDSGDDELDDAAISPEIGGPVKNRRMQEARESGIDDDQSAGINGDTSPTIGGPMRNRRMQKARENYFDERSIVAHWREAVEAYSASTDSLAAEEAHRNRIVLKNQGIDAQLGFLDPLQNDRLVATVKQSQFSNLIIDRVPRWLVEFYIAATNQEEDTEVEALFHLFGYDRVAETALEHFSNNLSGLNLPSKDTPIFRVVTRPPSMTADTNYPPSIVTLERQILQAAENDMKSASSGAVVAKSVRKMLIHLYFFTSAQLRVVYQFPDNDAYRHPLAYLYNALMRILDSPVMVEWMSSHRAGFGAEWDWITYVDMEEHVLEHLPSAKSIGNALAILGRIEYPLHWRAKGDDKTPPIAEALVRNDNGLRAARTVGIEEGELNLLMSIFPEVKPGTAPHHDVLWRMAKELGYIPEGIEEDYFSPLGIFSEDFGGIITRQARSTVGAIVRAYIEEDVSRMIDEEMVREIELFVGGVKSAVVHEELGRWKIMQNTFEIEIIELVTKNRFAIANADSEREMEIFFSGEITSLQAIWNKVFAVNQPLPPQGLVQWALDIARVSFPGLFVPGGQTYLSIDSIINEDFLDSEFEKVEEVPEDAEDILVDFYGERNTRKASRLTQQKKKKQTSRGVRKSIAASEQDEDVPTDEELSKRISDLLTELETDAPAPSSEESIDVPELESVEVQSPVRDLTVTMEAMRVSPSDALKKKKDQYLRQALRSTTANQTAQPWPTTPTCVSPEPRETKDEPMEEPTMRCEPVRIQRPAATFEVADEPFDFEAAEQRRKRKQMIDDILSSTRRAMAFPAVNEVVVRALMQAEERGMSKYFRPAEKYAEELGFESFEVYRFLPIAEERYQAMDDDELLYNKIHVNEVINKWLRKRLDSLGNFDASFQPSAMSYDFGASQDFDASDDAEDDMDGFY